MSIQILVRTPLEILQEIRESISKREPVIRAQLADTLFKLNQTFASEQERNHSPLTWIMQAQLGTLDKLSVLFRRDGDYETIELISIARNLFENLIWLRLFNQDTGYGLIFYEQLLDQQKQNTESFISKVEAEISFFGECEIAESDNFEKSFAAVLEGKPSEDEIKQAHANHRALSEELDMRARRSFALYAAAAKYNGYTWQRILLRDKVIPAHRATLAAIQTEIDHFKAVKTSLLSPPMLTRSNERWNWKKRAIEVGMKQQYEHLYSYTSKLLHATPINLVTEKALSPSETLMMLEYAFVTAHDIFDEIERLKISCK